jgi:hypothetical protein
MEYISIICWVLAAVCNAVMDTLADRPHFERSIFSNLNPEFWLKTESWDNKYIDTDGDGEGEVSAGKRFKGPLGFLNNLFDAWHIFQSAMVVFIVCAIVFFPYSFSLCISKTREWVNILGWILLFGFTWNITFMACYATIFQRKLS